jgi:hypothetical protein
MADAGVLLKSPQMKVAGVIPNGKRECEHAKHK